MIKSEIMAYVKLKGMHNAEDIAVMASLQEMDKPFFVGKRGDVADEHPAANILHNHSKNKTKGMCMYLNYQPSEIELGMLWRAKTKNVYFITPEDPNTIQGYVISPDGCYKVDSDTLSSVREILDEIGSVKNESGSIMDEKGYEKQQELLVDLEASLQEMAPLNEAFVELLNEYSATTSSEEVTSTFERRAGSKRVIEKLETAMEAPLRERNMPSDIQEMLRQGLNQPERLAITAPSPRQVDEDYIRVVMELVNKSWNTEDNFKKIIGRVVGGNNIGALMVSHDNKIIGWGLNYKGYNKTFHAETMMIQQYLRENQTDKLPDNAKIYTSLQCCHMCAGHIADLGKNIKVVYAQKDPYFAGENALTRELNGCSEQITTLRYAEVFADAVGTQDILEFLFDKLHQEEEEDATSSKKSSKDSSYEITRKLFARANLDVELKQELFMRLQKAEQPSEILQNGRSFMAHLSYFFYDSISQASSPKPPVTGNKDAKKTEAGLLGMEIKFDNDPYVSSLSSVSGDSDVSDGSNSPQSISGSMNQYGIFSPEKAPSKHSQLSMRSESMDHAGDNDDGSSYEESPPPLPKK